MVLLFQPAEEGGAGGKRFVEEGALEGVLGVHGIHVWPGIPAGIITSRVISPASHTYHPASPSQAHAEDACWHPRSFTSPSGMDRAWEGGIASML